MSNYTVFVSVPLTSPIEVDCINMIADTGPDAYKDVPICIQLVGQCQDDENLANVAVQVDKVVNAKFN